MKVRIGVGLGATAPDGAAGLAEVVDVLERLRFDSLWLSEVLTAPTVDPLVGLTFAAARTRGLKLGTTMVLPGRNPVRLAKELATLDRLSDGRLLLTFVLGLRHAPEVDALGVAPGGRGPILDEVMPLLRRLWDGGPVDHDGPSARFQGVIVTPPPVQAPLEMWLGGNAPSALERTGRLADGWLPALCTPEEAAAGRAVIDRAAAEAGREVDPEHFGVSLGYARTAIPEATRRSVAARRRRGDPADVVPVGLPALCSLVERFIDVGFSKFVLRPVEPPASWTAELEDLAAAVLPLQTKRAGSRHGARRLGTTGRLGSEATDRGKLPADTKEGR